MTGTTTDRNTANGFIREARKLLRKSRADESLRLLKCAYDLDSMNYDVVSGIAEILALGSESLEAVRWSKKAIALSPSRPEAYNWLQRASSRAVLRSSEKVGAWAIAVQPDNPLGYLFLATFLRNSGRANDSLQPYRACAVLFPVLGDPYFRLGGIQHAMDELAMAFNNYRRAKVLRIRPLELEREITLIETALKDRKTRRPIKISRWPQNAEAFKDIDKLLRDCLPRSTPWVNPPLNPMSTAFTLGSCFAQNIAQVLNAQGVSTTHLPLSENFNTSGANLTILRWILKDHQDSNFENISAVLDPKRKQVTKKTISTCDVMVYTMGVSPAFFDRRSGEHVIPTGDAHALSLIREHEFRTTTVSENVENLEAIITLIREANANAHIVLSVSPIPLTATFEMDSAIIADCVSKCIMRAAVHEVLSKSPPNVTYWPSFEVVKWIAPHRGRSFGDDDGSSIHVNRDLLSQIFERFVGYYSDGKIMTHNTSRDAFSNTKMRFSLT
jgi:tetratricopeptide (TPR) repeat protein